MRNDLPTGTVTFLFTDVEGSTKLLHELGADAYAEALAEHRRVVREACSAHQGVEVDTQGDAFFFAFPTAPGALAAAQAMTEALALGPIRVRIGLHTGTPLLTEEGYIGADVHRAARIAAAGHGRQTLVSSSTVQLVDVALMDLGEHRLKDLSASERIYQLGDGEFPPLKSLYRTNLPIPATPFLGRERELAEVLALLADTRLLTLTGPGGTGKTRLALQAAAAAGDSFPDGVFWVPLAPLRDPELVLQSASQALGAKNGLSDHILDKRLLVLFDNFEQVADAAPALSDLLAACPNLELVVTSREPLHLAGEQEYAVPSFVHEEAVGFFLARARAVRPEFEVDDAASEICRRLDDLPLALELAAARVKALTSAQLLERLEQRLPLLTGGSLNAPERQRTLRATIEWSYDLLPANEQGLFARLAIFRGGWTLEAAEQVADADLDLLQSLVDKSLVRFSNSRYSMLETIREYASELVAGDAQRHADYYLALVKAAEPELTGPAASEWLARLDSDHDNLRAVLDWSLEVGEEELGLRMAVALRPFWEVRGHFPEAKHYLVRLNEVEQPAELRALALRDLVMVTIVLNELDATERYAHERRALCLSLGDEDGASRALHNLGIVAEIRGDLDRARALFEATLASARERGADLGIPLGSLAIIAWRENRLSDAASLAEEALAEFEATSDLAQFAYASMTLAGIRLYQGRREDARPLLAKALQLDQQLHSPLGLALDLETAAFASRDPEAAGRLLGKAEDLRLSAGDRLPSTPFGPSALAVRNAHEELGQEGFDAAHAEGRAMSLDAALELALEVIDEG